MPNSRLVLHKETLKQHLLHKCFPIRGSFHGGRFRALHYEVAHDETRGTLIPFRDYGFCNDFCNKNIAKWQMNWWGSVQWSKQTGYTAADKPSSQFCRKSQINFLSKAHSLKTSYWPVSFSSTMNVFLKGNYLKCFQSGQKCERQELLLF